MESQQTLTFQEELDQLTLQPASKWGAQDDFEIPGFKGMPFSL